MEIHPTELQLLTVTRRRGALAAWAAIAGLPVCATLLIASRSPVVKVSASALGCALTAIGHLSSASAREAEYRLQDWSDISAQAYQNRLYGLMNPVTATVALPEAATPAPALQTIDGVMDEAVGIAILGNSGSGKSSVARYIIGLMGQVQILVLDPHDDGGWGDLPVVASFEGICEQLELLLGELDNRRTQKRAGQPLAPVAVVCDEWPSIRLFCAQKGLDVADRYLLRMGSEARKYEMLNIFCSQSGNVKALGLEGKGDFLENYLLIRLCKVAVKHSARAGERSVHEQLKQTAFACLVGDEPALHPTHGHYPQFRKGLPPANLREVRSLPLTVPVTSHLVVPTGSPAPVHPGSPAPGAPVPGPAPGAEVNHLEPPTGEAFGESSQGEPVHPADPYSTKIEPWAVELVHRLMDQGWSQNQIIPRVWHAQKGRGKRYALAREKFLAIAAARSPSKLGDSDTGTLA